MVIMIWYSFLFLVCLTKIYACEETWYPQVALPEGAQYAKPAESPAIRCSLAHLQGSPSAIVGGCVNVINGTYIDCQTDLVVPAVQPLMIQRAFASSEMKDAFFGRGYHLNHEGMMEYVLCGRNEIRYKGSLGEELIFHYNNQLKSIQELCPLVLTKGVTNCSAGIIDGRTNIKNVLCQYLGHRHFFLTEPNGDRLLFDKRMKSDRLQISVTEKKSLSGSTTRYEYEEDRLKKIQVESANGTLAAFVDISYRIKKHEVDVHFLANDGRETIYTYTQPYRHQQPYDDQNNEFMLWRVLKPNGAAEFIHYDLAVLGKEGRISCKVQPEGRFIKLKYYSTEESYRREDETHFCYGRPLRHRVKFMEGPIGNDSNPRKIYSFYYDFRHPDEGVCRVEDIAGNQTNYKWNKANRLTSIHFHLKDGSEYARETFKWGSINTRDYTNLIAQTFGNGSPKESFCRHYAYNHAGCVNTMNIYGNLTGQNTQPIILNQTGQPENNGIEHYSVSYHYNPQNLKMWESDGLHVTIYEYEAGTDRMSACFTTLQDQIKIRRFYEYDCHGQLTREIVDDGFTKDKHNLTGVSERKIRDLHHTSAWGLPAYTEEKYYDFESNDEKLLERIVYNYSREGWVFQEDHFDSLEQFTYALKKEYDTHGNVTLEQNPDGMQIVRRYDTQNNLLFEQFPFYHIDYKYDLSNRLTKKTETHPDVTFEYHYAYDLKGNKISSTDPYGHTTRYEYDEFNRLIKIHVPKDQGTATWNSSYDVLGNVIAVTDPYNHTTQKSYTIRGQPVDIMYADDSYEKHLYDPCGTLIKHIARDGTYTLFTYDYQDRPVQEDHFGSDGSYHYTKTLRYNAFHLLEETDPNGNQITYHYDCAGKLAKIQKGEQLTSFVYDSMGRKIKTVHHNSSSEETIVDVFSYNVMGHVIEERQERLTGEVLRKKGFNYDILGRCIQIYTYTDGKMGITTTTYDSHNTPIQVEDPDGAISLTRMDYNYHNDQGQRVIRKIEIDPLGVQTITQLNIQGSIAKITKLNPLGQEIQKQEMTYDLVDNLTHLIETIYSETTPVRQKITHCSYDAMGQLIQFTEGFDSSEQVQTTCNYSAGRKISVIKPDSTIIEYGYNSFGRMDFQKSSDNTLHDTYTYDRNGNVLTITDIHNRVLTRKYNQHNALSFEELPTGYKFWYEYDLQGKIAKFQLFDNSTIEYQHISPKVCRKDSSDNVLYTYATQLDHSGHLVQETLIGQAGTIRHNYTKAGRQSQIQHPLFNQNLEYDKIGNVTLLQTSDPLGDVINHYTYDSLYQLTSEIGTDDHTYSYDSTYNRLSVDDEQHEFNGLNQLINASDNLYTYDLNGNLIQKNNINYAYDALNRLTQVKTHEYTIDYIYDGLNRRLSKQITEPNGHSETYHFLYQGQNEIGLAKDQTILELKVLHLNGKGAEIGATAAIELESIPYAVIHDHIGNITTLLDMDGKCVEYYRYTAFGISSEPIQQNPWRFSSKRFDPHTQLIAFGRRDYDSETGRFLTKDPYGLRSGINFYAYVMNNPLIHIDLYGLIAENTQNTNSFRRGGECWGGRVPDLVRKPIGYFARGVRLGIHHALPLPGLKDAGMYPLHVVENWAFEKNDPYVSSFDNLRSGWLPPVGENKIDGITIMNVNGLNTTRDEFVRRNERLSAKLGNIQIEQYHLATGGFVYDLIDTGFSFLTGVSSPSERSFLRGLNGTLNKSGKNEILLCNGHSAGGEMLNRIEGKVGGREAQLYITTYGSPRFVESSRFGGIKNFINERDGVCYLNGSGYVRARLTRPPHVEFLPSKGFPIFDHPFDGGNYEKAFVESVRNALKIQ